MTNGWQTVQLGKVMQVEIDAVPVDAQPEFQMAGVYSFARGLFKREPLPSTHTTYKFFHRLHKDMFVISVPKGWEGALARVTDEFDGTFLSPVFPTFRANPKELDIKYFEWYCRQSKVWEELRRKSRGIGARRESVSAEQFLTLEIPLPPLTEQHRIVAEVESLAARINEAQRLREEAEREAKAILHSAQNQFIGSTPNSDWVPLKHYIAEIRNGKSPDCEKRPAKLDEWGVLKVGAVSFGTYDENQNKALPTTIEPNPEYEVKVGDFLMIRANTRELVGACAIVEKTRPKLLISDKTFRFIFREDHIIDKRYLNHVLKSPALRIQIEQQATGTSPTMKNISKEKVTELKVPCIPLDEQRRIVAYLDALQAKVNALRELQSTTDEELSALMPSILDKAFKGEL